MKLHHHKYQIEYYYPQFILFSSFPIIVKKENCQIPMELAQRIAEKSERNLRRAILLTEACRVEQYPFTPDQKVMDLDWEAYMKQTGKKHAFEK